MRVALINPPMFFKRTEITHFLVPPLSIMYLGATLREAGHSPQLIDAAVEAPEHIENLTEIYSYRGLSLRNIAASIEPDTPLVGISCPFTLSYALSLALAREIKRQHPQIAIVMGGAHPTAMPEEVLADSAIDYVVLSEGENTLIALCNILECNDFLAISELDGIGFKVGNEIRVNPKKEYIQNLDSLPFPARDLVPHERYYRYKEGHGPVQAPYTTIISSRGCPFHCTFCTPKLWNHNFRTRSPKNVVDELEYCIREYGIREFHFEDENLTLNKKRILKICQEIIDRNLNIRWQTPNGIRASVTDDEILNAMYAAGCRHITVAPESGSPRVLTEIMRKQQDLEHIERVVKTAGKVGLKTSAFFILGVPGERPDEAEASLAFSKKLARMGLDEAYFGVFSPLPGSELYDKLRQLGHDFPDWSELESTGDMFRAKSWTEHISDEELRSILIRAYRGFFISKLVYHPLRFGRSIFNILLFKQHLKTERSVIIQLKHLLKWLSRSVLKS